jgi:TatD DNase family protein
LAKALDRPVSIHCRGAWESLAAIAKEVGLPQCGAVIHSFSGSAEVARQLQGLGFHISFSCSLANPENRRAAKALRAVERDHLLFETDAPDIAPRGIEINEPAQINLVLKAAAGILGVEEETLAAQVHENSRRIFGSLLQDANPSMRDCTQS